MIERWGNSLVCIICDEDAELPEGSRVNPENLLIVIQEFEEQHRACGTKLLAQMEREMRNMPRCQGAV